MAFTADKVRQGVQQAAAGGYSVDNSLRFNDDDSAYLSWTPSSAGNRKTWTWSGWVKRGNITLGGINHQTLFSSGTSNAQIRWSSTADRIDIILGGGFALYAKAVQRDCSSWYHIIVSFDTTQATNTDRVKIYFNGELADRTWTNHPSQNTNWGINNTEVHNLSRSAYDSNRHLDGYLAEVHFIDGQALDPTSFGETGTYGEWKPIEVTGMTYGTNGFYLDFSNSGSLGTDASSNTNNWTVNNLQPTDQMLDSPTNNFCTWNPGLSYYPGYNSIFSEGNLKGGRSDNGCVFGSILMTTGKWYAEMYFQDDAVAADASNMAALFSVDTATNISNSTFNSGISYRDTGDKVVDGTNTSYGASYSIGDIIGIAVDVDTGNVTFYKNNTSQGSISLGAGDDHVFACGGFGSSWSWVANFGQDSSFAGNDTTTAGPYTDGGGIGDFFYEPPSGYLALCTQNLPDPAVIPSEHFNTVTYAGNSSSQSITGVGFQPDFLWIKARNDIRSNTIWDAVRGINHQLYSDTISGGDSSDLASFDSDGFSFSSTTNHNYNNSANTYVAWNWNCPTTFSGNTDGSITSSGRTNTDAGMSIFTYTGTQANATVGHGLGSIPEMVIFKTLDADNWAVYHKKTTATGRMRLNLDAAVNTDSEFWQNTEPTSSLITLGFNHSTNATSGIIAYAFRSIEGYSKVGAYIGNGITDGAFVYTGFRPAYVMIKRASAGDWYIWNNKTDGYNVDNNHLRANYSSAENTDDDVDLLSNGFKWRTTNTGKNASGVTILYLAFAEQPFKHSNAR